MSLGIAQIASGVRRRWLALLCVFAAGSAAAIVAAVMWPPRYVSKGTILIEQQELPTDFVRSTVSSYATQRIQVISQRVMTTDNLLGIIKRYDLYPQLRDEARETMVAAMRRDANLQMISAEVMDPRGGGPMRATIAFAISYANPSPQLAAKVANELVSLYLQQNIESRQRSSRDAAAFLGGESGRLVTEINALQGKLAQLKLEHASDLPELKQLNMATLDRAVDELRETDSQLQLLTQQQLYIDAQLAQLKPDAYTSSGERVPTPLDRLKVLRSQYARAVAVYSADHPDVQRLEREIAGLTANLGQAATAGKDDPQELEDARSGLATARQRYGADHPDILRLERLVSSLEQQHVAQVQRQIASATATPAADEANNAESADNPAYIQLASQRRTAETQRKLLEARRVELRAKVKDYEQRLERGPSVEQDYFTIVRDLESAQTQYRLMRQKQMDAQMSVNLEVERKGERFTLIDPPLVPGEPTSPNRKLIVIFGLIVSLALGIGLVVVLEVLDGSIRGRADLQQLLAIAPLAVIPRMLSSDDLARSRRRRRHAFLGATASVVLAVMLVHFLYRPLDLLWMLAMRRFGVEI